MKRTAWLGVVVLAVGLVGGGNALWAAKTGSTEFEAFQGKQDWPVAESATILTEYAVPVYVGLPPKPYTVLGRITDPRTDGVEVVGKVFDEAFEPKRRRYRNVADQARAHGAAAVVVTNDPKVILTLGLKHKAIRDTAPLYEHRDSVVLAVKF